MVDFDTAALVAEELGAKVEKEVHVTIEERLPETTDTLRKSIIQFTETEPSISKLFLWTLLQRLTMTLWTLSSLLITRK